MIVGFDYWQVISHYPEQIGILKACLNIGGNECHIISAIGKGRIGTIAKEIHSIDILKGEDYWYKFDDNKIHEVVFDNPKQSPELKLAKCKELGIEMFFDDRDDVCRLLNANGIMALRVTRKDNSTYDLDSERK
jgi:hypothetical protein